MIAACSARIAPTASSARRSEHLGDDGVRRGGGERSFIHYLGANAELTDEDVDFEIIRGAKILHIGSALLVPKLDGAAVCACAGPVRWCDHLR